MRLYNKGFLIAGIVIFVILMTVPIWLAMGKPAAPPRLSLDTPAIQALPEKRCLEDTAYMRADHMRLLNAWRDGAVREGKRQYTTTDGKVVTVSLSGTCLKCHSNYEEFCNRCHNYAGAKPKCFSCHIIPGEVQ